MIKLQKLQEPAILAANKSSWTQILLDHDAAGTEPSKVELSRYGHPEIKSVLLNETHSKCAYCESLFRHLYPGDVEHILPKKQGRALYFEWSNLTIACSTCNTKKGIKDNLLDPYEDDPDSAFHHAGPMLLPSPTDPKAGVTETALGLNRKALLERRAERLKNLHRILQIALAQADDAARDIYLEELTVKETADNSEYAAMARSYVADLRQRGIIK